MARGRATSSSGSTLTIHSLASSDSVQQAMPPKTTTAAQRKERKEHYKQLHSNKATSPNTAQKLYRSLHDQIDSGFLDNALKSADKSQYSLALRPRWSTRLTRYSFPQSSACSQRTLSLSRPRSSS